MSLRNADYHDRELLFIVDDLSTEEGGYASTADIAEVVFGVPEGEHANGERRYVGSRMAWMARYGFVERDPERAGHYKLTKAGRELKGGKLTKSVQNALERMSDADRALVMRSAASEVFAHSGPAQEFFRREYTHHFENRTRPKAAKR